MNKSAPANKKVRTQAKKCMPKPHFCKNITKKPRQTPKNCDEKRRFFEKNEKILLKSKENCPELCNVTMIVRKYGKKFIKYGV